MKKQKFKSPVEDDFQTTIVLFALVLFVISIKFFTLL